MKLKLDFSKTFYDEEEEYVTDILERMSEIDGVSYSELSGEIIIDNPEALEEFFLEFQEEADEDYIALQCDAMEEGD